MSNEETTDAVDTSPKSYTIAVSLSALVGFTGAHHIYLRRYLGFMINFSLLALAVYCYLNNQPIWATVFAIINVAYTAWVITLLLSGSFKDGKGRILCYPGQKLSR